MPKGPHCSIIRAGRGIVLVGSLSSRKFAKVEPSHRSATALPSTKVALGREKPWAVRAHLQPWPCRPHVMLANWTLFAFRRCRPTPLTPLARLCWLAIYGGPALPQLSQEPHPAWPHDLLGGTLLLATWKDGPSPRQTLARSGKMHKPLPCGDGGPQNRKPDRARRGATTTVPATAASSFHAQKPKTTPVDLCVSLHLSITLANHKSRRWDGEKMVVL